MGYYNVRRNNLPKTHPYYNKDSNDWVCPLCLTTKITDSGADYSDKGGNLYVENPYPAILSDSDLYKQNNKSLLHAGWGLGLEEDLEEWSSTSPHEEEWKVQKNANYGYDIYIDNYAWLTQIAPLVYFEVIGGGGGGADGIGGSNLPYASGGGGGGGGCVRGLLDLSQISNVYIKVGKGGAAGSFSLSTLTGNGGDGVFSSISTRSASMNISAEGGTGGKADYSKGYANCDKGTGGKCYDEAAFEISSTDITDLTETQPGMYLIGVSAGGNGGRGGTSTIYSDRYASYVQIRGFRLLQEGPWVADASSSDKGGVASGSIVGGNGGGSAAGGSSNGANNSKNATVGSFPGCGGGGGYKNGGHMGLPAAGTNGRVLIRYAKMRAI